jgi:hypothetical protein
MGGSSGGGQQGEMMARMQQQQQQQQQQQMQQQMQQRAGMPAGYPGMANQGDQAKMQQSMMAAGYGGRGPGGQGGPGSMVGAGPGMGGAGADNGPADTRSPEGAVRAFLKALKAKDRDALAEATAQRAASDSPLETTSTHKELFGKILDNSISDAELDDLASKLDGFQITAKNPPNTTKWVVF